MIHHIARNQWGISPKHCKLIYTGAIEPALLYAAQIWGHRANLVHLKRKLLSVQRSFAIRICRAYRTAPTDALLVIANITPIPIKINSIIWTRNLIKNNPNNQVRDNPQSQTININTLNQVEDQEIIDQIIINKIDSHINSTTGHGHPADSNNTNIIMNEESNHTKHDWEIYTDGAKNSKGTGAAMVIYNNQTGSTAHEEYYKLADHCSINQAELWAMEKTLHFITSNIKKLKGSIKINTDSRYVLNCIKGTKKNTATGVNIQYLARILSKLKYLTFSWVPGHSGSRGNERADVLAKRATSSNQLTISFSKLPQSYIRSYIQKKVIKEWQNNWSNSSTGRLTHLFLPSISCRQKMTHITPSYAMTQLLTGHGNLPSYLYRFKKRDDNHCICDNISTGDVSHILEDCPLYDTQRDKLKSLCTQMGKCWPPPWEFYCETKEAYGHLETFVKECGIFDH
ncbi:uncharacterized protein LOC111631157 [Centruroides sculpturatus]|uniref:uncharacterized protein LOC111631157 n=1 Tax=Centruroides sculpturatus TaxID=218467 RepID=UPI000C6CB056|nr:uncharacterized protein LOC111631157 [Centruroides sculpturatus]